MVAHRFLGTINFPWWSLEHGMQYFILRRFLGRTIKPRPTELSKIVIKKFILYILYYKFNTKTIFFFWKHVFSRFMLTGIRKCKKGQSFSLVNWRILCFFSFETVFDRIYWPLDFKTLGMPLGRFPIGLGKSFYEILK